MSEIHGSWTREQMVAMNWSFAIAFCAARWECSHEEACARIAGMQIAPSKRAGVATDDARPASAARPIDVLPQGRRGALVPRASAPPAPARPAPQDLLRGLSCPPCRYAPPLRTRAPLPSHLLQQEGDVGAPPRKSARQVIAEEAARARISVVDLIGEGRRKHQVAARQRACWRLSRRLGLSLPRIGMFIGGRDHTTVLHAVRKLNGALARKLEAGEPLPEWVYADGAPRADLLASLAIDRDYGKGR